jgi:hypothetical protein
MKRRISLIALVAFTAGAMLMTGCKKDDTTAPTISLTGGDQTVSLGSTYSEPGYTANDDEDGDITSSVTVSGTVNTGQTGTYPITYTVSDAAGNSTTETRTVTVKNDADAFGGTYSADDTCQVSPVAPYTATVTPSSTVNNRITIANFGGFGQSISITATVATSTSTINFTLPQTIGSFGSLIAANGSIVSSSSPVSFGVVYTWNDGTSNETCTSTYIHQ